MNNFKNQSELIFSPGIVKERGAESCSAIQNDPLVGKQAVTISDLRDKENDQSQMNSAAAE